MHTCRQVCGVDTLLSTSTCSLVSFCLNSMVIYHIIVCFFSLQASRAIWLGKWNPKRDRDPDKRDEVAFKEFLITKYERKNWYCTPAEIKKEEKELPKPEPKLQPPPSSNKVCTVSP